jgi:hypothetical protein
MFIACYYALLFSIEVSINFCHPSLKSYLFSSLLSMSKWFICFNCYCLSLCSETPGMQPGRAFLLLPDSRSVSACNHCYFALKLLMTSVATTRMLYNIPQLVSVEDNCKSRYLIQLESKRCSEAVYKECR